MNKTRKILACTLVSLLVMIALLLSACGENKNTNTTTNTTTNTSTESNTNTNNTNTNTSTESEEETVYYYVYVMDQNEKPIEGVNVQICKDGLCLRAQITDANGMAKFEYFEVAPFKAQINSVPEDCVMPSEEYFPFPEGDTTTVVTIQKQQTYSVTASSMVGGYMLSDILVELYDAETDELVESARTEENGRVVFIVSPADYYVIVKNPYDNAAFVLTGSEDDGKLTFEKTKNLQAKFAILEDDIAYNVTLNGDKDKINGVEVKLYDEDFALVGTQLTNENGEVTFNTPNGTYYATAEVDGYYIKTVAFEKDKETTKAMALVDAKAGSNRDYPIYILGDIDVTINAGEEVWYYIPNAEGKVVEVASTTATIRQVATNNTHKDGVIKFELLPDANGGVALRFSTSLAEGSDHITGKVYVPGSEKTPHELDFNNAISNGMTVDVKENGKVYYSFVSTMKGTITATTETENAVITINGNPFKKSVELGDTVVICFYTEAQEGDNVIHPAATIVASFEQKVVEANYKVTTVVDNKNTSATIELYEKIGQTYELRETVTTDADGNYVFNSLTQTANYYIKVKCQEGYEAQTEYTPFGDTNEVIVYINHVRDGSLEYPFLIISGEEEETATLNITLDGTTKWYSSHFVTGAQISIDNGSATVKVYTATSADSEPTLVSTLTGDAKSYTITDDLGTTASIYISVEGASGTVKLTFVSPEINASETEE